MPLFNKLFGRKSDSGRNQLPQLFPFDYPHDQAPKDMAALLGGKGANLAEATAILDLPVPPGFTIPTGVCREFMRSGWPTQLSVAIKIQVNELERRSGRSFGHPDTPLLLSVRSGAENSMPGMMDTILNVGLNDQTVEGLVRETGDEEFAWGCYRRFTEMYLEIVMNLNIPEATNESNRKRVQTLKDWVRHQGISPVPEDTYEQLQAAVAAVFASWQAPRAQVFRERENIAHDLGTAVNIQTMVFGNMGAASGTGVVFTRDPATGENVLFGDFLFDAQGEDVVAGTHKTDLLEVLQTRLPAVYAELSRHCRNLERQYGDMCDIEFTVERGRLWILQNRVGKRAPQAAIRIAVEMANDPGFPLDRTDAVARAGSLLDGSWGTALNTAALPLTSGIAASPGVASGKICFSADDAVEHVQAGKQIILVRRETSPADVHGMAVAAGILTTQGGLASHAAVVARAWGIPAVVGAQDITIKEAMLQLAGQSLLEGASVTIDGNTGHVYAGTLTGKRTILAEAEILRNWVKAGMSGQSSPSKQGFYDSKPSPELEDSILRLLGIKGLATVPILADSTQQTARAIGRMLTAMLATSLVENLGQRGWRLTETGQQLVAEYFARDCAVLTADDISVAMDSFHKFNHAFKSLILTWQMRDLDGHQVVNDHHDKDYDNSIIDQLVTLDRELQLFLESLAREIPRLLEYCPRFAAALSRLRGGEAKWMAAPIIDSYHTIWFELHEDLIRMTGSNRTAEGDNAL